MYDNLPKNQKTFTIDVTGEDTFVSYKGEFTVKCVLNMSGKHALELEKTRLMADYANPSAGLRAIAVSLATVRSKIVKAPDWWSELNAASELLDENVIIEIFEKCIDAEIQWRDKVKELADKTSAPKEDSEGN